MKRCPFCAEEIQDQAIVCRFCGRDLPSGKGRQDEARAGRWSLPVGAWGAIAALTGGVVLFIASVIPYVRAKSMTFRVVDFSGPTLGWVGRAFEAWLPPIAIVAAGLYLLTARATRRRAAAGFVLGVAIASTALAVGTVLEIMAVKADMEAGSVMLLAGGAVALVAGVALVFEKE